MVDVIEAERQSEPGPVAGSTGEAWRDGVVAGEPTCVLSVGRGGPDRT